MSVPYMREAAAQDDLGKLVRLHLGDGNEAVGKSSALRTGGQAALAESLGSGGTQLL